MTRTPRASRSLIVTAGLIAVGATLANAAHELRRHIVYWLTVRPENWLERPSDVLGSWVVIAVSAAVFAIAFTSAAVIARGRKVAVSGLALATPFVLFGSMMPIYSYVRRGYPDSWFVCPSERHAYAAPLSLLIALAVVWFLSSRQRNDNRKGAVGPAPVARME